MLFITITEEEPYLCISRKQSKITINADVRLIGIGLNFSILTEFECAFEQRNGFDVTFEVVEVDVLEGGDGEVFDEFVVVEEEGDIDLLGVALVPHGNGLGKPGLAVLDDIDDIWQFLSLLVLVFCL